MKKTNTKKYKLFSLALIFLLPKLILAQTSDSYPQDSTTLAVPYVAATNNNSSDVVINPAALVPVTVMHYNNSAFSNYNVYCPNSNPLSNAPTTPIEYGFYPYVTSANNVTFPDAYTGGYLYYKCMEYYSPTDPFLASLQSAASNNQWVACNTNSNNSAANPNEQCSIQATKGSCGLKTKSRDPISWECYH